MQDKIMSVRREHNTTPPAGLFSVDDKFHFRCNIRKGDRRENPRGGKQLEFKASVADGLGVAKAKVISFMQRTLPSSRLISEDLYLKNRNLHHRVNLFY